MLRRKEINKYLAFCICCLLVACSSTKYVPDGQFLLNKMEVEVDRKEIKAVDLNDYVKQKPNYAKFRVRLYSLGDTTNWFKRFIRKMGDAPVIYDPKSVDQSVKQLQIEMVNKGYLNAKVEATRDTAGKKKMNVHYKITGNDPYRIRNYTIDIPSEDAEKFINIWNKRRQQKLKPETVFDISLLEEERVNASKFFRNVGYYTFSTDNLYYLADTTLRTNQVDLTLTLRDSTDFRPYYINKVTILSGYDPLGDRRFRPVDTVTYRGLNIVYDKTHFIRPHVLFDNVTVQTGNRYSERRSEQTYDLINSLSAVSKTSIEYKEVPINDTTALDCNIYITPANIHGIQIGLDGTNNAGDLGIAANISYTHGNIFNGSETLNIKLRGAYEFISGTSETDLVTHNYYEAGIGTSLLFPKIIFPFFSHKIKQRLKANTQFGIGFDIQKRPEYTRDFFNASWKYKWDNSRKNMSHTLNFLIINFVAMPYKSAEFQQYLDQEDNYLTKASYDNVFTAGNGYNGIYTNTNNAKYQERLYTLRYGVEFSGNLLQGLFKLFDANKNADGQYQILGNPFAQYAKFDFDFSQTYQLDEKNGIAIHSGLGVAYPYGNSTILPFEKRYYAGGPNSVRGWNTRGLGPGTFNAATDVSTQTGDISLLLNAEFRHKFIPMLEFATFIDAGNIWTIKNYDNQPGGLFRWDSFYKEMALGVGIGLRLDLSFLIIRVDGGKKLYDPTQTGSKPWVLFEKFGGNSALYFAIGYPF